jgi:dihydroxy-acid dehydratase
MADIDNAGGIPAVLNRLKPMLKDSKTINGNSIIDIAENGKVIDPELIRDLFNPIHKEGGIAVLKGNIASSGIIKQTALDPEMRIHSGPAKVFFSEQELLDAIETKKIAEGDVVVLPFQGPAGAPGMPEMLTPTDAIKGAGYKKVALITDGRFSGATVGPCIGHVEMEAYNGGPIGAIQDGDIIDINIADRSLNVRLTDNQIKQRLSSVTIPERTLTNLLKTYRQSYTGFNCYGKKA